MRTPFAILILLIVARILPSAEETVLVQACERLTDFTINADSGDSVALSLDAEAPAQGTVGLRLTYDQVTKGWVNVRTPVRLIGCVQAVSLQVRKVSAASNAVLYVWFLESDGDRWISRPVRLADLPAGWTTLRVPITEFTRYQSTTIAPIDAGKVNALLIGLNGGASTLTVDDVRYAGDDLDQAWRDTQRPADQVAITDGWPQVASFRGFGGEWDPKFWTMGTFQNTATDYIGEVTVTEADWQLQLKRLRWMRPSIMRIMMCLGWCHPGGTWNPDTAHMRSLYRHLDFCQEQGIEVILSEWGLGNTAWLGVPGHTSYADAHTAAAIATYLDHLIRQKGYTCIKHFVLGNEPNWAASTPAAAFTAWKPGVPAVHQAIAARGLDRQVSFMGSDAAQEDLTFHRLAVDQLASSIDAWDVHLYADPTKTANGKVEAWYRDQVWGYVDQRDPLGRGKLRVVSEVGVLFPGFTSSKNPMHLDFLYNLAIADHAVQATRAGTNATLAWMYSDSSHKGFSWGMWGDKTNNFMLKPWFSTWALLSRCFPRGCRIATTSHGQPGLRTLAGLDGPVLTVLLVNRQAARTVTLVGEGLGRRVMRRYVQTAGAIPSDADGFPLPVATETVDLDAGVVLTLPAASIVLLTTIDVETDRRVQIESPQQPGEWRILPDAGNAGTAGDGTRFDNLDRVTSFLLLPPPSGGTG